MLIWNVIHGRVLYLSQFSGSSFTRFLSYYVISAGWSSWRDRMAHQHSHCIARAQSQCCDSYREEQRTFPKQKYKGRMRGGERRLLLCRQGLPLALGSWQWNVIYSQCSHSYYICSKVGITLHFLIHPHRTIVQNSSLPISWKLIFVLVRVMIFEGRFIVIKWRGGWGLLGR
jgi:hypothetical protein